MTHTYNLRARRSPSHLPPPPPTTETARTRRSKATQKELAPSNHQKKVATQINPRQPTRQSKRSRPAEPSEERARKRHRATEGPASSNTQKKAVARTDLPPPTRQTKRSRPIEPVEERSRKRHRADVDPIFLDVGSQTSLPEDRNNFKRPAVKLNRLRRNTSSVWRIVAQTEEVIARASASARCLLKDVMHLDAQRGEPSVERDEHEGRPGQREPPVENDDIVPSKDERRKADARKVAEEDFETFLEMFQTFRSEISGDPEMAFSSKNMRTLSTFCEDWGKENSAWHDCRRTKSQQGFVDAETSSQPRPRVGVDEQGHPFHDWSACQRQSWPPRRLGKERIIMSLVGITFNQAAETDELVLPAPLRPRRPRVFADQYRLQFHDIPKPIYRLMERWHRIYGRCAECVLRAIKTFPTWMLEVNDKDQFVDGNPVFVNLLDDELAEWDETGRRWRLLVLDHYRWIPVQELEERLSDSNADPAIVNGTINTEVPYDHWYWT